MNIKMNTMLARASVLGFFALAAGTIPALGATIQSDGIIHAVIPSVPQMPAAPVAQPVSAPAQVAEVAPQNDYVLQKAARN